jgi:hypothetical protein
MARFFYALSDDYLHVAPRRSACPHYFEQID